MTKSPRHIPIKPLSMLFCRYSDGAVGRTTWIESAVADKLRDKFKKKPQGGRPIYVVRCYPKQIMDPPCLR